jgi:amino acid transporter
MQISLRDVTTAAALEEKQKLQKGLKYADMIFFTSAALIGLDTLGAFSANGGQALTWLLFSAVTFLLPYGLLTAELGSTFTNEGGVYEWCKLAGGRFYAAITSMLYWISNPLWIAGTLSVGAIAAIKTFWFGSTSYLIGGSKVSDAIIEMVIALLFIWGTTWCAIMSLRFGKYLSVFGSYVKLALLTIFIVLGFTLSTNTLAYLFIFPAFLLLRYRYPDVPRTYRVPGGMPGAWIVTLLPFAYAAIAGYFILIPPDSYVSKNGVSRLTYELTQFIPLAVIVLLTVLFYVWGQREKRNKDVIADYNIARASNVASEHDASLG